MEMSAPFIHLFPETLSPEECLALIALSEALGFESARIEGALDGPQGFRALQGRDNSRAAVEDVNVATLIWSRLAEKLPAFHGRRPRGINERLRFYRYDLGQSFPPHTDGYHDDGAGLRSELTLLLYLNADFEGGETVFTESGSTYQPASGAALIFSHDIWHEGRPLKSGRKYVLRTDVMFARA